MIKFRLTGWIFLFSSLSMTIAIGQPLDNDRALSDKEKGIIRISVYAAQGDLVHLNEALHEGLKAGLTVNEIKESLIHLYAYAGFPRSIRGLQTLMAVVEERNKQGYQDESGKDASGIEDKRSRYDRGKDNLEKLTGIQESPEKSGYAAFAPTIEVFLKEHLFADLFERDVLTFVERELVTISVLSGIGGVEPMLKSHLNICLNLGITPKQLNEFDELMQGILTKEKGETVTKIIGETLQNRK